MQAAALVFYGLRLNMFLFARNRISSRMQEFQKKIEERAQQRGNRLARFPFVLSCGLLYYGLVAPVLLTSKLSSRDAVPAVATTVLKALVGLQWFGYIMGAIADFTKSYVKESEKDGKFLVTSGIFSILRHPNFTGEIIAWTANSLCGTVAAAYLLQNKLSASVVSSLGLTILGWVGIVFVLLRATANLEERQKKEYGATDKYKKWVEGSWSGWMLPVTYSPEVESGKLSLDDQTEESSGSGI
jgi:protein-S-isoprenylcysteine O-methyltransferase Ste14